MNDFFPVILAGLTAIAMVFFGVCALEQASCSSKADKMEMEHSWTFFQGCMVKDKGRWWPIERYLVVTPNE